MKLNNAKNSSVTYTDFFSIYIIKNFIIKNVCCQRINCEIFFKLWSLKWKSACYINPDIAVTMVTKRTFVVVKIHVWYSKGVFVPN